MNLKTRAMGKTRRPRALTPPPFPRERDKLLPRLGQMAVLVVHRFMAREQVQKKQGTLHAPAVWSADSFARANPRIEARGHGRPRSFHTPVHGPNACSNQWH